MDGDSFVSMYFSEMKPVSCLILCLVTNLLIKIGHSRFCWLLVKTERRESFLFTVMSCAIHCLCSYIITKISRNYNDYYNRANCKNYSSHPFSFNGGIFFIFSSTCLEGSIRKFCKRFQFFFAFCRRLFLTSQVLFRRVPDPDPTIRPGQYVIEYDERTRSKILTWTHLCICIL